MKKLRIFFFFIGVLITVLCQAQHEFPYEMKGDTMNEYSLDHGVLIEGVLLKDGAIVGYNPGGGSVIDSFIYQTCSYNSTTDIIIGDTTMSYIEVSYNSYRNFGGVRSRSGKAYIQYDKYTDVVSYYNIYLGDSLGYSIEADRLNENLRLNIIVDNTYPTNLTFGHGVHTATGLIFYGDTVACGCSGEGGIGAVMDSMVYVTCAYDDSTYIYIGDTTKALYNLVYNVHRNVDEHRSQSGEVKVQYDVFQDTVTYSSYYLGPDIGVDLKAFNSNDSIFLKVIVDAAYLTGATFGYGIFERTGLVFYGDTVAASGGGSGEIVTFKNGLTKIGDTVGLGGNIDLDNDTTIINVDGGTAWQSLMFRANGDAGAVLSITSSNHDNTYDEVSIMTDTGYTTLNIGESTNGIILQTRIPGYGIALDVGNSGDIKSALYVKQGSTDAILMKYDWETGGDQRIFKIDSDGYSIYAKNKGDTVDIIINDDNHIRQPSGNVDGIEIIPKSGGEVILYEDLFLEDISELDTEYSLKYSPSTKRVTYYPDPVGEFGTTDSIFHQLIDTLFYVFKIGNGNTTDITDMVAGAYLGVLPVVQDSIILDSLSVDCIGANGDITVQLQYGSSFVNAGTGLHTNINVTTSGGEVSTSSFTESILGPGNDIWGEVISTGATKPTMVIMKLFYHEKRAY